MNPKTTRCGRLLLRLLSTTPLAGRLLLDRAGGGVEPTATTGWAGSRNPAYSADGGATPHRPQRALSAGRALSSWSAAALHS